jgi:LysM repeat protein
MPERKPNQIARVAAVLGLLAAIIVVGATVATSGGGSDNADEGGGDETTKGGPTAKGERAVEAGVWIVDEGDTLVSISEQTGIDLDVLVELNPEIDPQALSRGQRIALTAELPDEQASTAADVITEGSGIGDGVGEETTGTGTGSENSGSADGISN